jgi:hypothetical protein
MKTEWALFVVSLLVSLAATVSGVFTIVNPDVAGLAATYQGKIVFQSESEYIQFKQAMSQENVRIEDVDVLSSAPPIIVKFKVTVPGNVAFPYGEKYSTDIFGGIALMLTGLFTGLLACIWRFSKING